MYRQVKWYWILTFVGVMACRSQSQQKKDALTEEHRNTWQNAAVVCQLKEAEEPIKQFPYSQTAVTATAMQQFCERMKNRFSSSELTVEEANRVYQSIFDAGLTNDASYGMPGPGVVRKGKPLLEDIKKRVSLRKTGGATYELFYSYTSCGTNFEYVKITIANNKIANQERLEAWSGSYPC